MRRGLCITCLFAYVAADVRAFDQHSIVDEQFDYCQVAFYRFPDTQFIENVAHIFKKDYNIRVGVFENSFQENVSKIKIGRFFFFGIFLGQFLSTSFKVFKIRAFQKENWTRDFWAWIIGDCDFRTVGAKSKMPLKTAASAAEIDSIHELNNRNRRRPSKPAVSRFSYEWRRSERGWPSQTHHRSKFVWIWRAWNEKR